MFSQIISKLDRSKLNKHVKVKQTDKHCKGYTSWTHLVSMLFCRFAKRQSVRNISNGLHSSTGNLNHLGIHRAPSKSSIMHQNKHWEHEFPWKTIKRWVNQDSYINILILNTLKAQSEVGWYLSNLVALIRLIFFCENRSSTLAR